MGRRIGTTIVVVLVLVGLTTCAGDDDDAEPVTTTEVVTTAGTTTTARTTTTAGTTTTAEGSAAPTRDAFIAEGDALCATVEQRFADLELGADVTVEGLEALVTDEVVPAMREEHDGLAELTPPAGDEEEIAAVLAAFADGIDAVEADPLSLLSGTPLADAQEAAAAYGFEVCGTVLADLADAAAVTAEPELGEEEAAVAAVVEELFDGSTMPDRGVELVEGGESMRAALQATVDNPLTANFSSRVTDVTFPDDAECAEQGLEPGCALAVHDFYLGESVVSAGNTSYLLRDAEGWKVTDASFCDAAARAGTPCPEQG